MNIQIKTSDLSSKTDHIDQISIILIVFVLYLVDGELNSLLRKPFLAPTPFRSFLARGWTLINHAYKRVLSEKGKYLTLHNFLLFRLRKNVTA